MVGDEPKKLILTSQVKIWLFLQWGFCLSSLRQSFSTKIPIMHLFELDCVRQTQTSPWLETATIILIRGEMAFWGMEKFLSVLFQWYLRQSDWPTQLSSMLITTTCLWLISRNFLAYCYLSTSVLSELLLVEVDLIFLYLNPYALSWVLAYQGFTSIPLFNATSSTTSFADLINLPSSSISWTTR